ncbi:helix-turn-helix domain-containing protein [Bradyrhizobium shewense]|uniref:helix-turn-helix domain-containing protein n=1 Tax=Bradyrhizobium shewense TaxID=1761772 RepID=UPI00101ADE89
MQAATGRVPGPRRSRAKRRECIIAFCAAARLRPLQGKAEIAFASAAGFMGTRLNFPGLFTRSGARRWWMPRSTAMDCKPCPRRALTSGALICELAAAAGSLGIAGGRRLLCPVTQQHIADACGLSVVDANCAIQELRQLRLVEWDRRTLTLLRRERAGGTGGLHARVSPS